MKAKKPKLTSVGRLIAQRIGQLENLTVDEVIAKLKTTNVKRLQVHLDRITGVTIHTKDANDLFEDSDNYDPSNSKLQITETKLTDAEQATIAKVKSKAEEKHRLESVAPPQSTKLPPIKDLKFE